MNVLLHPSPDYNPDAWLSIFSANENYVFAERCIGVLGTLATLHRQRGNLNLTVSLPSRQPEFKS